MRTYRRIKALASGATSQANKGILIRCTVVGTITMSCLDATGNAVSVPLTLGVGNSIFPVYVKSFTNTGTMTVWELN
jgi:hypothetical protein